MGVAQRGGELWSPSQPEMGTIGKIGEVGWGGKEVAETGNRGPEGCLRARRPGGLKS